MAEYKLLVTEITNYGDLRCVAGWDLDRNKMIRPEPHAGGFWHSNTVGPVGSFEIGKTVRFEANKPNPETDYPHRTEDRVVVGTVRSGSSPANYRGLLRDAAFASFDELFDRNLVIDGMKAYVPVGSECRSLGGLIVDAKGVEIESYRNPSGKDRIRLQFRIGGIVLAPNITASEVYASHASGELDALNQNISQASKLLLRVGLARAFDAMPDRCYLQINGLTIL